MDDGVAVAMHGASDGTALRRLESALAVTVTVCHSVEVSTSDLVTTTRSVETIVLHSVVSATFETSVEYAVVYSVVVSQSVTHVLNHYQSAQNKQRLGGYPTYTLHIQAPSATYVDAQKLSFGQHHATVESTVSKQQTESSLQ